MRFLSSIIYKYNDNIQQKWIDPDKYGYLDVVSDIYCLVLKHVPEGRTVSFTIKCTLPDEIQELEIRSDQSVMNLFLIHDTGDPITLNVCNLQVSEHTTREYTINGYPSSVVGRENPSGNLGMDFEIFSTLESNAGTTTAGDATGRVIQSLQGTGVGSSDSVITRYGISKKTDSGFVAVSADKFRDSVEESILLYEDSSDDADWKYDGDEGIDTSGIHDEDTSNVESEDDGDAIDDEDQGDHTHSVDELSDYNSDEFHDNIVYDEDNKVKLEKGQVFASVYEFRAALQDFIIQEGVKVIRRKNDRTKVTTVCANDGCKWRVHASPTSDGVTFMIKKFNPNHDCRRVTRNPNATSTWIAKKLDGLLRADPEMSFESMQAVLSKKYDIEAHPKQLYRARLLAKRENEGSHKESYAHLPKYGKLVLEKNPGSVFKLQYYDRMNFPTVNPVFKRLFVCFEACKVGFVKGCRPFIGLDGCHLKGMYGGVLLAAVSLDGNNGLFPLAFAVVESECKDSWQFFLDSLYRCLFSTTMGSPLTFMSDQQKGLSEAISQTFPQAHHRFCCRHMYTNFKKKHPSVLLRAHFWNACQAPNAHLFTRAMNSIRTLDNEAHSWLMKIPVSMWARHAFDHRAKSDHITNNMTESFNRWIDSLRTKPILTLIDQIRVKLMGRLQLRYQLGCTYKGRLTPRIKKRLDIVQQESRTYSVIPAGGDEFEVSDHFHRVVVNMRTGSCDCKVWEVTGLPCKHVAAVNTYRRGKLEDLVAEYYTVYKYLLAHGDMIHPLPDLSTLEDGDESELVQPPPLKRLPGRPRKNRRREPGEAGPGNFRRKSGSIRCDICKEIGHNRRTCQRAPVNGKRKGKQLMEGQTTSERRRGKRMEGQDGISLSQRETRSQSSVPTVALDSVQATHKAKIARKQAKRKERASTAR